VWSHMACDFPWRCGNFDYELLYPAYFFYVFSHRRQYTAYPPKLITPASSPPLKIWLLTLSGGGALTTYPSKLSPQNLSLFALRFARVPSALAMPMGPTVYSLTAFYTKLNTHVGTDLGKKWLGLQAHGVKGQGHAATNIEILRTR